MNDFNESDESYFGFGTPAFYMIKVLGEIKPSRYELLLDMTIHNRVCGDKTISVLQGKVADQAALSGIMNALFDMHHSVLSVEMISQE